MLAEFCLRLAAGMLACLLILPAHLVNPRYFRTHFLIAMGLTGAAWLMTFLETRGVAQAPWGLPVLLAASLVLTFAGSFVWALEGAPAGKTLVLLATLTLAITMIVWECREPPAVPFAGFPVESDGPPPEEKVPRVLPGSLTSAAVLGAALSAMLMGHIYLIAPAMSLSPLLRLLALLGIALAVRMAVEGYAFWCWTSHSPSGNLGNDVLLFLPVRWFVGFVLPLILTWMAWQATRIRSTQSATGILYVVVVFCFLGELVSLVLRENGVTL